jgi:hypothetical protein
MQRLRSILVSSLLVAFGSLPLGGGVVANTFVAPGGADDFFVIGWAAAADDICRISTYWIVLQMARSHGLTDKELIEGVPKVAKAIALAQREVGVIGPVQWCANYKKGLLERP